MKKLLLILVVGLFPWRPAYANQDQVQLNYVAGNIWATAVSDTTTAGALTYLRGSRQQQVDIEGNKFSSTGFQIQAIDASYNAMDFIYSYNSNPGVVGNLWKGSVWGPMQRYMTLPANGFYVSPTFTATGSIIMTFESLQ
jgi:hypothetical protein